MQYLPHVGPGFFAPFSFLLFHERRRPALVFTLHSDVAPLAWAACLRTSQAHPPASFLPFAGRSIAHPLRKQAKSHTSAYGREEPSFSPFGHGSGEAFYRPEKPRSLKYVLQPSSLFHSPPSPAVFVCFLLLLRPRPNTCSQPGRGEGGHFNNSREEGLFAPVLRRKILLLL